jgi:3-hydroxyisobutyrate dehydrogenase-like beta-hydroxyacid dehydrogenase
LLVACQTDDIVRGSQPPFDFKERRIYCLQNSKLQRLGLAAFSVLGKSEESMTTAKLSVACLGLGRIGAGIARSVQRAGHRLIVYNRTPEKAKALGASGAEVADSPRDAASRADVVLTCLMDDDSVRENLLGENSILTGMRAGAIHIGTSTVTPKGTAEFAELHARHGTHYLAATFAGHPDHAAAGKLISFVAGPPEIIERARPVLDAYTGRLMVIGDKPALAASFKLTVNFFAACLLETMGEAFVFAEKQGLNLETVSAMLKELLQHPAMPRYLDKIRTGNFEEVLGSTLDGVGSKDLRLILETAAAAQTPLPIGSIVRDKILAAQARGLGECDWSVFTEIARLNAGQERTREKARPA